MKVAFFVGSFPEISETFILRQITGLIDLGHEVDIYADGRPKENAAVHPDVINYNLLGRTVYMVDYMPEASGYWEMPVWPISGETWLPGNDIAIPNAKRAEEAAPHLIECLSKHPKLAFEILDPREYGIEAESLSSLYRLATLSRQEKKYDVLHAHFGPNGNCFRFARELWKAPLVVTFHGWDFTRAPREQGKDMYFNLFKVVDAVTVNSEFTRGRVKELGCPDMKISKLHVGLDTDQFSYRERVLTDGENIRLLTVARLVEIKGYEFAIKAFAKVYSEYPNIHYDIIGEGPMRNKIEQLIRELGIKDAITLHGAMDTDKVREKMNNAHLFLLTSVSIHGDQEGQGLVLQEAQACGLPVIATDHGAFPEGIVPGGSGFIVDEWDIDGLALHLSQLIKHSENWGEMGKQGRKYVEENYDIYMLNQQLLQLYIAVQKNFKKL